MSDKNLEQKVAELIVIVEEVRVGQEAIRENQEEIIEKLAEMGPEYFRDLEDWS